MIDLVRHGQSVANAARVIDTAVPGAALTALGQQQAQDVANVLAAKGPVAAIFASQLIRTQQTAAPLAAALGMNVQVLPGLNEIDAGIFNGMPQFSLAGLAYLLAPVAWLLGLRVVPMLAPGSADPNGYEFHRRFSGALQTMSGNAATTASGFNDMLARMYGSALANPVRASDGRIREVAFSSEFDIGIGTMTTVKTPNSCSCFSTRCPTPASSRSRAIPTMAGRWSAGTGNRRGPVGRPSDTTVTPTACA